MVFKIFLNRTSSLTSTQSSSAQRIRPNKRIMDRFNVSHHRLRLSGSKGGYLVKDLSEGGFSATAMESDRADITLGDAFTATLSFRGASVAVHVKAAWLEGDAVGLQFIDTEDQVERFLHTILTPVQMGATLTQLEASFMQQNAGVLWFHGDFDSNITIELSSKGDVKAWSFYDPECLVVWRNGFGKGSGLEHGLATGARTKDQGGGGLGGNWHSATQLPQDAVMDHVPDPGKMQFVYDVLQLFESDYRSQLISTIEEHLGI